MRLLYLLFFLSGATGLVYEVIWTRWLVLLFGSSVLGISSVVAAFLGGLALGGACFGKRADRIARPLRWYGILEIGVGVYAALLPALLDATFPLLRWIWSLSAGNYEAFALLRFLYAGLLLLPPTVAMGASLPLISAYASRRKAEGAAPIGRLYGWNTLGAVTGTIAAGFFLLPSLGILATALFCAAGNVGVGLAALWADRKQGAAPPPQVAGPQSPAPSGIAGILLVSMLSGFAALAFEVCWSRLFGMIYGSSLHGFCLTLAGFLIGIGLGSLGFAKELAERRASLVSYAGIEFGIAAAASLTLILVREIVYWNFLLFDSFRELPVAWMLLRYAVTAMLVLVPTVLMGMAFPLAVSRVLHGAAGGAAAGRVYAWNTLGSILGSFCAGYFLLPALGLERTFLGAILLFLALGVFLSLWSLRERERWGFSRAIGLGILAAGSCLVLVFRPPWNEGLISSGGVYFRTADEVPKLRERFFSSYEGELSPKQKLFYWDGRNASVGIYKTLAGQIYLEVNGKVDASSGGGDMPTQILSGLLPMLTDREPEDALVIGCGSGTTLGVLTLYPVLRQIELVELERAVVEGTKFFENVNYRPFRNPERVRWIENDGRNHLLLQERSYDLIVSEPSNPWMSGAANLFTAEFFRLVRERLRDRGLFCQWLQLYSIEPDDLRVLVRTLLSVFPDTLVFKLNDVDLLLLSGKDSPPRIDLGKLLGAFEHPELGPDLEAVLAERGGQHPGQPASPLSFFRLNPTMAKRFAGEGPLNTDDNLWIESSTPFSLFRETTQANREAIDLFPSPLRPSLIFPESPAAASRLAEELSLQFRARGLNRFADEMAD